MLGSKAAVVLAAALSALSPAHALGQHTTHAATTTPAPKSATPLAPELSGLGTDHLAVTTAVPKAQTYVDQGLRLLLAFNHQEARRAFQEAARLDPSLAMAHWGEALTLAQNLNAPMTLENARLARAASQKARRLAAAASDLERGLIEALARRFAANPAAPRPPLERAYADAMTKVAAAHPDDPTVQTLYADAVMNTMPWDYWQKDGTPKPATATLMRTLEGAIAAHPKHAGAHHYYIHLIEASPTPERAEASADALGALMPSAGHMVHMPAHIYLRVGRYADAADANVRAIAADEDYLAQCQAQGLYPVSYYPHNLHFLWAAATLEGRSGVAIDAARQVAAKVPHHHAGQLVWTADFPVTPWLAYVRFGQWQQMLTEPAPPVDQPYATGIWHYGRALAFVARNQLPRAETELAALTKVMAHRAFGTALKDTPMLPNLQIASRIVAGELAARAGRPDDAVKALREGVAIEDALPYSEPPIWHHPVRQVLGAVLLEAGRAGEAETAYREDLARVRENGWSLFGLTRALEAQGKASEAAAARARFDKAWARADFRPASSRVTAELLVTPVPPAPATPARHEHEHMPQAAVRTPAPEEPKATAPLQAARQATIAQPAQASHTEGAPMVRSIALPTGVTLQYAERGSAAGLPMVLLHGVTDSWRSFEHVLPHLPPTVRAIAVSLRGHGESSRPTDDGYTYADMAGDVRALMDALDVPAAVVVGHSMGSLVAQRLAADHPSRVAGLVLIGAFAAMDESAGVEEYYTKELATLSDPVPAVFARDFQVSTLARDLPPGQLDVFVGESLKVPARVWRAAFKGFVETPAPFHDLRGSTVPTLLIWGTRDVYVSREDQQQLRTALPAARLIEYAGTGHAVHWEQPRRVADDIVAFLYRRS